MLGLRLASPCVYAAFRISRKRMLWMAASSSNTSLAVAASQCAEQIRQSVLRSERAQINTTTAATPTDSQRCAWNRIESSSCFVLVCQSYPPTEINGIVGLLRQQLADISKSISFSGTVVDRVILGDESNLCSSGLSILYHSPSISPGLRTPNHQLIAHPFYIGDMHGRQRLREVAVGRWHNKVTDRFKEQGLQSAQWISGTSTVTQATSHLVLPSELANSIDNPLLVEFVLFATDKESRQTLDLLDSHFPQALKIGIVGAQTPFLNGREYTLFSDSQVYDTGMVGFAFSRTEQSKDKRCAHHDSLHVAHNGLEPVSEVLRILRCKGNVILEVENGAAARSLLASVRSRRITRPGSAEESSRLYARIVPEKGSDQSMMCQVTGGDPAKGGLALDTLRDLSAGQYIQFMMTAAGTVIESKPDPCIAEDAGPNTVVCNHTGVSMQFGAADLLENSTKHHHYRYSPITKGNRRLLKPVFGGVTEGGFVYGRQSAEQPTSASKLSSYRSVFSGSVECSVPGSTVTLSLS